MDTECEEENVGREKGTEIIFKLKANPAIEKYRLSETYVLTVSFLLLTQLCLCQNSRTGLAQFHLRRENTT